MTISIQPINEETHAFRVGNGHEWMDVTIRTRTSPTRSNPENKSHDLMIHSSYGSWGFNWRHAGSETWREWFSDLQFDYMMGKLMGAALYVAIEPDEAWDRAKRCIVDEVKRDWRTAAEARKLIQAVRKGFSWGDPESINEVFNLLNEHDEGNEDGWNGFDFNLTKINPQAMAFWDTLWAPFVAWMGPGEAANDEARNILRQETRAALKAMEEPRV